MGAPPPLPTWESCLRLSVGRVTQHSGQHSPSCPTKGALTYLQALQGHACFLFKFSDHMASDNSPVMRRVNFPCSMSPVRCWGPECFHTQVTVVFSDWWKETKQPQARLHISGDQNGYSTIPSQTVLFVSRTSSDCPSLPFSHFILCPLFRVSDILVSMWEPCKGLPFPRIFFWRLKYRVLNGF